MSTTIEKTQQIEFVNQVLPSLFHSTPEQFLHFLERDGTKFLNFYWNQAGKNLSNAASAPAFGLNYEVRRPQPQVSMTIIRLPQPQTLDEAYFAALIYRPYRFTSLFRVSDTTNVFSLEKSSPNPANPATRLVEWTKRIERHEVGLGQKPALEDFVQTVLAELKD